MPPINQYQNNPTIVPSNAYKMPSFWRRRSTKLIIFGLLAIVIVIIVVILLTNKSPKTISEQFVNDVIGGQSSQTYKLADKNFRNITSATTWSNNVQSVDSMCTGKASFTSSTQTSTTAEEFFKAKGPNDTECHIEVDLSYTSGKWGINALDAY